MSTREQLLVQYGDVVPGLDLALTEPKGVRFPSETYSQAIRLQQRIRKFLKAYREASTASSKYDILYSSNIPKGETEVIVKPRTAQFATAGGELQTSAPSTPVEPEDILTPEDIELAAKVRRDIIGD